MDLLYVIYMIQCRYNGFPVRARDYLARFDVLHNILYKTERPER